MTGSSLHGIREWKGESIGFQARESGARLCKCLKVHQIPAK